MRIGTKLIANTIIVAIIAVVITATAIGYLLYMHTNNYLEQTVIEKFISLRDTKAAEIEDYYSMVAKQVVTFAHGQTIKQAMHDFTAAFNNYATERNEVKYKTDVVTWYAKNFTIEYAKVNANEIVDANKLLNMLDDNSFALQYNYILHNPYPLNNKSQYNYADDGSKYSQVHKKLHPIIREYQEQFHYQDILLVDSKTGDIVYSVQKELDYTTSLINGPYASSAIGKVFQQANAATRHDFFAITDFEAYFPSYNNVASFVAAPIFNDLGDKIGVLIFRLSIDFINKVMTNNNQWENSGWGHTGESYIIGQDAVMRTMSRFFLEEPEKYLQQMSKLNMAFKTKQLIAAKKTTAGLQKINSAGAIAVMQGKTGVAYYTDYRNLAVIAAYKPLNIYGLTWGIICGIDKAEAFAMTEQLAKIIIFYSSLLAITIAIIAVVVGYGLSQRIKTTISQFNEIIYQLADSHDLSTRFKITTNDELGQIATALNMLLASLEQASNFNKSLSQIEQNVEIEKDFTNVQEVTKPSNHGNTEQNAEQDYEQDDFSDLELMDDDIDILTAKLENLAQQFKHFEQEADKISDW